MVEQGLGPIVLIDPRTAYDRERTWCYWQVHGHPFEEAVSHRWNTWRLQHQGRVVEGTSEAYPYCHIRSDDFFELALSRLRGHPEVTLRLGEGVESLEPSPGGVLIRTTKGTLRAKHVFDSRPPKGLIASPPEGEITLLQHFLGIEVETEEDAFEPGVVTLMDFDVEADGGVHFMYVLPFSRRHALIEDTFFSSDIYPKARYEANIKAYLKGRLGVHSFKSTYSERGVLPMTTAPMAGGDGPGIYRIGVRGGVGKPSSGYAFLGIQRHSLALAKRLATGMNPSLPPPRGRLDQLMDRILLSLLDRDPTQAPEVFMTLFDTLPQGTLLRFLSEVGTFGDRLEVARSLPGSSLSAEAIRSWPLWLGRPR